MASLAGVAWGVEPIYYTAELLPQLDTTDSPFELTFTSPHGINEAGQVTGQLGDGRGFLWGGDETVFLSPVLADADWAGGAAVTSSGAVAGNFVPQGAFKDHPFYMSASGEVTVLPTRGEGLGATVSDLNDAGLIVGSAERFDGGTFFGPTVAVYWRDGVMRTIGTFNGYFGRAAAVNAHGAVVGYANVAGRPAAQAFRWTEGGGVELLEVHAADRPTLAHDINDHGVVVGHVSMPNFQNVACYWDADGGLHLLPQVHPLSVDIDVRAVNNRGVMVGMELLEQFEARLWLGDEVYDLNDLTTGLPDGYILQDARDVTDAGVIVSEVAATIDGQIQLFTAVLTPRACSRVMGFAEPFFERDFADAVAYLDLFSRGDPGADLAEPHDQIDISDVLAFLSFFESGCP